MRDRELRGIVGGAAKAVLDPKIVDDFAAREPFKYTSGHPPGWLFTSIDPFGGGDGSSLVIITGFPTSAGGFVVRAHTRNA